MAQKPWLPPETIFDGSMEWHVELVDEIPGDPESLGETNNQTMTIRLVRSMDPSRMKQLLLHEIIHVIHFGMSGHKQDTDEDWVDDFSHGLMRIFEQNPDIIPRKRKPRKTKSPESR